MLRRPIVLDENIPARLAGELGHRGRDAVSLQRLGWRGETDDEIIARMAKAFPDGVLITADDRMPKEHEWALVMHQITVATIDPQRPVRFATNAVHWQRDVVHRWVHLIERQEKGSIRRYGEVNLKWADRRGRKVRRKA